MALLKDGHTPDILFGRDEGQSELLADVLVLGTTGSVLLSWSQYLGHIISNSVNDRSAKCKLNHISEILEIRSASSCKKRMTEWIVVSVQKSGIQSQ